MKKSSLVYTTLVVYLIPIILMIAGYFSGVWLGNLIGIKRLELAGIAGAFIFLIFFFSLNKLFNSYLGKKSEFQPVIKKLINRN